MKIYSINKRDYWEFILCSWSWFVCFKALTEWDNTWRISPYKTSVVVYTPWIFITGIHNVH